MKRAICFGVVFAFLLSIPVSHLMAERPTAFQDCHGTRGGPKALRDVGICQCTIVQINVNAFSEDVGGDGGGGHDTHEHPGFCCFFADTFKVGTKFLIPCS